MVGAPPPAGSSGEHGKRLLDAVAIRSAIAQMATDIAARAERDAAGPRAIPAERLALVGIRTGGEHLARRLANELLRVRGGAATGAPPCGVLDITLYRDDVLLGGRPAPLVRATEIAFDVERTSVVLVDDVLFTGRTVRAALDALLDLGRPACVRLAVLVDRGLRELPIAPDFVGHAVETAPRQRVTVALTETGAAEDAVWLQERP